MPIREPPAAERYAGLGAARCREVKVSAFIRMAAIVLACGSVAAEAQEEQLIFLTGGRVYRGTVLDSSWEWVKVRATVDDTENDYTVDVDELDPHFFYTVRDKALGDDAAGRIRLAKYCVDNEMFSRAQVQMERAEAADAAVVEDFMKNEFPKIRDGIAQKLLEAGRRSLRRGSTKNANQYASIILTKFEGTPAEAGAEALLDEVQKKIEEDENAKRAARRRKEARDEARAEAKETREAEAAEKARDALLGGVERQMDAARRAYVDGLKARSVGQSQGPLEAAASRYEAAMKSAEQARAKAPDEEARKALEEMRDESRDGAVQAYLALANGYASRGTYQKATTYCNKALALDPGNVEAKQTRLTISTSVGWRRGRR